MKELNTKLEELTGKSIAELESITKNIMEMEPLHQQMTAESASNSERCASIGVLKVVDIGLCADLKLDGDDWHIKYRVKVSLFGNEVWSAGGTLDKNQSSITYNLDLVALKATITIGCEDFSHFCPFVDWDGKVYVPIIGWQGKHIHERMFCLL